MTEGPKAEKRPELQVGVPAKRAGDVRVVCRLAPASCELGQGGGAPEKGAGFTLGERIEARPFDVIELLEQARFGHKRAETLDLANVRAPIGGAPFRLAIPSPRLGRRDPVPLAVLSRRSHSARIRSGGFRSRCEPSCWNSRKRSSPPSASRRINSAPS